jgi:hypothetical protein
LNRAAQPTNNRATAPDVADHCNFNIPVYRIVARVEKP